MPGPGVPNIGSPEQVWIDPVQEVLANISTGNADWLKYFNSMVGKFPIQLYQTSTLCSMTLGGLVALTSADLTGTGYVAKFNNYALVSAWDRLCH